MNVNKTGAFISELRKDRKLTQQELGDLLHVSDKAISRWETGRGFPDIATLEPLADALHVSVAELLKGERIQEDVPLEEVESITKESLHQAKGKIRTVRKQSLLFGFFAALLLFTLTLAHLRSPITLPYQDGRIHLETLDDGRMLVSAEGNFHLSVDPVNLEGGKTSYFLSCHTTLWDKIFQNSQESFRILKQQSEIDSVYYYPGNPDDIVLYRDAHAEGGGVQTLPRLIYNYWLFLGALASAAGGIVYLFTRKKAYRETVLKVIMLPVTFTLSMILILVPHMKAVYNAPYYLSGILLTAFALYALFLLWLTRKKQQN